MTNEKYDEWLYGAHYHDLLANPYLKGISLHTVSEKPARLSSGAKVENKTTFQRLALLEFDSLGDYDAYIRWFQEHPVPQNRTPAGKSDFVFYLLSKTEDIRR